MRLNPLTSKIVGRPTEANLRPTACPGDVMEASAASAGLRELIICPEEFVTSPKSSPVYVDCACRAIEEANTIATRADMRKQYLSGAASIGSLLGMFRVLSICFFYFLILKKSRFH